MNSCPGSPITRLSSAAAQRWAGRILTLAAFWSAAPLPGSAGTPAQSQRWDFGLQAVPPEPFCVKVDAQTLYTPGRGYGLMTRNLTAFQDTLLASLPFPLLRDGLKARDSIEFRADVPPGSYIVEIVMHGGRFTAWRGLISVNGERIADTLRCDVVNAEGEAPPPFWEVVRRVSTDSPVLRIVIRASGQETAVAGISCFPDEPGPVVLREGQARASRALRAPNAALCLDLMNTGAILEARRLLDAIPEAHAEEKAALMLALASRADTAYPTDLIDRAQRLLRGVMSARPTAWAALSLRLADLTLQGHHLRNVAGWQWARDMYPHHGIFDFTNMAGMCFEAASALPDHPLFIAALWLRAKTAYGIWLEQHDRRMIRVADSCFAMLNNALPDSRLLPVYRGDRPFDIAAIPSPPVVPRWAFLQQRATGLALDIIRYWVTTRQAANGEFGGKYDDDVEMMRWWPFARLVYDDSLALLGMKRLVDGIWRSGWIERGFSRRLRDVEHAAEPVADTQPMMIGFDYGNPVYVERCMESAKGLRDLWTGINARGHRHFKSAWYSATAIDTTPPRDCDLAMNTRTVKAALWVVWYNRHPVLMQFLREWGDAWLEDCLRTDKGKPAGIVPAAIRYHDDAIGGHADNWHHPGLSWDYFDYNGGAQILQQLLLNTVLFGDRKYLAPLELSLALLTKHKDRVLDQAVVGSEEWAARVLRSSQDFWEVVELWRLWTGETGYDDLLVHSGSPFMKFLLSNDDRHLQDALTAVVNDVMNAYVLNTTEAYFTDRVDLRDPRRRGVGASSLLEAMLTGASLSDAAYPFNRVSWKGFDRALSALVIPSARDEVTIRTFLHAAAPAHGDLVLVDSPAGRYRVTLADSRNGVPIPGAPATSSEVTVTARNVPVPLTLSPGREQLVRITCVEAFPRPERESLADLAVTREELVVSRAAADTVTLHLPVHNIGTAAASGTAVTVEQLGPDGARRGVMTVALEPIPPPLDLDPRITVVRMSLPIIAGSRYLLRVDPDNVVREINEGNNQILFDPPVHGMGSDR